MITELENNTNKSDSYVFCQKIFSSSKEIQSVELVNKKGRLVERFSSNDIVNLLSHKKEMFHMSATLQESMKKDYDDELGKVNYSYVEREKVSIFSFGVGDDILIVTLKNAINPHVIAKEIISFLAQ